MTYLDSDARLIKSLVSAEASPPEGADDLFVLYALLMRVKGDQVTAENVHDAWSVWMRTRDPLHPALVPFEDLSPQARAADIPYVEAIRKAFSHRS